MELKASKTTQAEILKLYLIKEQKRIMAKKVDFVADFKPVQVGHKDVLDKDLFIEAIRLIQNQSEKMRKFDFALDEALRMVCDGAIYVDLNNEYYTAALLLLERGMHDRAKPISWWLTEGQHTSVTYEEKGVQVEKKLDTAEDLYEYLLDDYDCQMAETTGEFVGKAVEVDEEEPEPLF